MNKNITKLLLWAAVLPGSLLAAILASFFLHLILYNTISKYLSTYPEIPENILTPFVFMFTFIWTGHKIAPNKNNEVAIFLFAICIFLSGGLIVSSFTGGKLFGDEINLEANGLATIMGIIGAFWSLYSILGVGKQENNNSTYDASIRVEPQKKVDEIEIKKISFFKKNSSELYTLLFAILFLLGVFIENIRFILFILILIITGIGIIIDLLLKDKNDIDKNFKKNIFTNLSYFSLIGIGVFNSFLGYYVNILLVVFSFFNLLRSIVLRIYSKRNEVKQ